MTRFTPDSSSPLAVLARLKLNRQFQPRTVEPGDELYLNGIFEFTSRDLWRSSRLNRNNRLRSRWIVLSRPSASVSVTPPANHALLRPLFRRAPRCGFIGEGTIPSAVTLISVARRSNVIRFAAHNV